MGHSRRAFIFGATAFVSIGGAGAASAALYWMDDAARPRQSLIEQAHTFAAETTGTPQPVEKVEAVLLVTSEE